MWFVPISNPDGYEYTFDVERLWRKNLRDNDGNGEITVGDGVDLNRNFPNHFKYDAVEQAHQRACLGLRRRAGAAICLVRRRRG